MPSGGTDRRPDRGLTVTATGGTLTKVRASAGGRAVEGTMNQAGTAWHSTWALGVGEDYTVTASPPDPRGAGHEDRLVPHVCAEADVRDRDR